MSQSPSCPIDGSPLDAELREDVRVHSCPQCRGMWLDRAELDKIIAKGASGTVRAADPPPNAESGRPGFGGAYGSAADQPHLRRRRGLLETLFG